MTLDKRKGRYHLMVWKFGEIWQCRVDVYDDNVPPGRFFNQTRLCLNHEATYPEAIKKVHKVVREVEKGEHLMSVQQYLTWAFSQYPLISESVLDILAHCLLIRAEGWLDGKMIHADAIEFKDEGLTRIPKKDEIKEKYSGFNLEKSNAYRIPKNIEPDWLQACWYVLNSYGLDTSHLPDNVVKEPIEYVFEDNREYYEYEFKPKINSVFRDFILEIHEIMKDSGIKPNEEIDKIFNEVLNESK